MPLISAANAWPRPGGAHSFQVSLLCCDQLILATIISMFQSGIPLATARLQEHVHNDLIQATCLPAALPAADIRHDCPHLMLQVGGFKAQRSWVTALSWAAMPTLSSSSSSSHSSSHPEQHHHNQLQQQDQLLLITGSSDGCLRLHSQSVQSLGEATVQSAGVLVEGEVMQLRKTLLEADLLGVTCLSVKLCEASSSGKLPSCSGFHQTRAIILSLLQQLVSLLCMTVLHCCCHTTGDG